jgi:hypothetical protein
MEKFLLFIPIENIGLTDYAQNLSLFAIYSVLIIPFLLILYKFKRTSLFNIFLILILWMILSTIFNINIKSEVPDNLFRAVSGLIIGFSTFVLLREIFFRSNIYRVFVWLKYSFIIILIFSIYDLMFNFSGRLRIYASYTEPSHLGNDLALIYLPMFLLYLRNMSRIEKIFFFVSGMILAILTFSATTYVKILLFILFYLLFGPKNIASILSFIFLAISISGISLIFFYIYPDNYFVRILNITLDRFGTGIEELPVTLLDRISFWIFLFNIKNIDISMDNFTMFVFGGGLGNDSTFVKFLPHVVEEKIISVKGFSSYITSFLGRIFSYGGIVGLILYLEFILSVLRKIKYISFDHRERGIYTSWLIVLFLSTSFGLGPFQSIALWFLPAYVDGLSLKLKQQPTNNNILWRKQ